MVGLNSFRGGFAGKAKCYYVYVQHSRTGALTSLKVRLKQYLSITYVNPEPMLISVKQMKSPNHSILANEDIRMDVEI